MTERNYYYYFFFMKNVYTSYCVKECPVRRPSASEMIASYKNQLKPVLAKRWISLEGYQCSPRNPRTAGPPCRLVPGTGKEYTPSSGKYGCNLAIDKNGELPGCSNTKYRVIYLSSTGLKCHIYHLLTFGMCFGQFLLTKFLFHLLFMGVMGWITYNEALRRALIQYNWFS